MNEEWLTSAQSALTKSTIITFELAYATLSKIKCPTPNMNALCRVLSSAALLPSFVPVSTDKCLCRIAWLAALLLKCVLIGYICPEIGAFPYIYYMHILQKHIKLQNTCFKNCRYLQSWNEWCLMKIWFWGGDRVRWLWCFFNSSLS